MNPPPWHVYAGRLGWWFASAPVSETAYQVAGPFPSWREAYDYAHTHPSNRKETT